MKRAKVYGIYRNGGSGQTLPTNYAVKIAEFLNREERAGNYEAVGDDSHARVSDSFSGCSGQCVEIEREEDWDGSITMVTSFHPKLNGDKLGKLCRETEKDFFKTSR